MGSNPINLAFRFLLEMSALISMGGWGWNQGDGGFRYILAFGIPLLAASIWGVFAVPDDPSRSGSAPVAVPGILRLLIEIAFFSFAVWAIYNLGYSGLWWIMGLIIVVHYLLSYDRILWLIQQRNYRDRGA